MLFAWFVIWANEELPNARLAGAAHCTWLNTFSTSMRTDTVEEPPVLMVLPTDRSTLLRFGDRTPGSVRGALPKALPLVDDVENAFLFRSTLSVVPVDVVELRIRSVMSPDTRKS